MCSGSGDGGIGAPEENVMAVGGGSREVCTEDRRVF